MSLASVILLINNNIIPNNNNEITADVLRPILLEMLQQPNDLIGALSNLQTDDKSNLVNAINEVVNDIGAMSSVKVLSGDVDPNTIVQQDANPGDLYSQTDALGNPIKIWIYDGNSWQSIDVGNAVLFTPQPLTATQQQIARDNVSVYSRDEVNALIPGSEGEDVTFITHMPAENIGEPSFIAELPQEFNANKHRFLWVNSLFISDDLYIINDENALEIPFEIWGEEVPWSAKVTFKYTSL